jgi:hypothetical protein
MRLCSECIPFEYIELQWLQHIFALFLWLHQCCHAGILLCGAFPEHAPLNIKHGIVRIRL